MQPTKPTSVTEYKVIRWLLIALLVIAVPVIGVTIWKKSNQCAATCKAKGYSESKFRVSGSGGPNADKACTCLDPTPSKK